MRERPKMSTEKKGLINYIVMKEGLRESFGLKLFRSFTLSIVAVLLVFTPAFVYYQNRAAKEELVKEGKVLAGLLAYNVKTGVFAENVGLLKEAVRGIMSQKNVVAVNIYAAGNGVLLSEQKNPQGVDLGIRGDGKGTLPTPEEGRLFEVIEGETAVGILTPVVLETPVRSAEDLYFDNEVSGTGQTVIGYVKVTMSKAVLDQEIKMILLRSGLIALAFLLVGISIVCVAIRKVTQPLTKLTEAVRALGAGDTVEQVPVESRDEIGRLAMSFNTMYENLCKRDEEKSLLEERLRHSQKMEAVGTLARGIAHDFNNILSTVQGSVYILEKKIYQDPHLRQYILRMHNSLTKAKSLIQGLITFSKLQNVVSGPVDFNLTIRKLMPTLVSLVGENVRVKMLLSEGELMICADKLQIEQVMMNLCLNARDAMPDGGAITVKTAIATTGADYIPEREMPRGRYALVEVSDTGTGMDEETKGRVFEPFFTTKEVGKGTGLGLSIVFGIVEQIRGYVEVHTTKGEGTVFVLLFPLLEKNDENADNKSAENC